MSSRRRLRQRSSVDVLDDVDWQDKRVRAGISTLLVVAAVAVVVGSLDQAGTDGALTVAVETPFTIGPTVPRAMAAPVAATSPQPSAVAPPTTPAPQPQALAPTTTAFVPSTARPTEAPTTTAVFDLHAPATCSVTSAVRPGSLGADVSCVQGRLRQVMSTDLGSDADGFFGPGTETAVRRFQQASGLSVNGVVGASTARLLGIWQDADDGL